MSWNDKTKMICTNCGKEYEANISSLTIATKQYKLCPFCKKYSGIRINSSIINKA